MTAQQHAVFPGLLLSSHYIGKAWMEMKVVLEKISRTNFVYSLRLSHCY